MDRPNANTATFDINIPLASSQLMSVLLGLPSRAFPSSELACAGLTKLTTFLRQSGKILHSRLAGMSSKSLSDVQDSRYFLLMTYRSSSVHNTLHLQLFPAHTALIDTVPDHPSAMPSHQGLPSLLSLSEQRGYVIHTVHITPLSLLLGTSTPLLSPLCLPFLPKIFGFDIRYCLPTRLQHQWIQNP